MGRGWIHLTHEATPFFELREVRPCSFTRWFSNGVSEPPTEPIDHFFRPTPNEDVAANESGEVPTTCGAFSTNETLGFQAFEELRYGGLPSGSLSGIEKVGNLAARRGSLMPKDLQHRQLGLRNIFGATRRVKGTFSGVWRTGGPRQNVYAVKKRI